MKARTPALGLLLLAMFFSSNCLAQKVSYTSSKGLTIGLGAGAAYQKSDLANSKGYGFDFILGSQLYRKENAFLSVDWKFRFLAGVNKAFDHRINPDDTYSNIRYNFFNYDLELGLTLNRLRERTGIVLTGFAGAGLTHGRTFTDLYDAGNNLYDYSGIDPNRDSKLVYNDLVALSDGEFETRLVNKAAILPTTGFFIGYQLTGSITLGVEYKTNFYLTEKNSLVGIDLDNRILDGSGIDRNTYVSLGFGWTFRGGSSVRGPGSGYTTDVTNTSRNQRGNQQHVVAVSLPRPTVHITDPPTDPYHTTSASHTIRATVSHVSGADHISFYQNGFPNYNFTYNPDTKSFIANIRLREGENSIRIKAENQTAVAEDRGLITLDPPQEEALPAPTVWFTSPPGTRATSSNDRIDVTATVKNVRSEEDIHLTMDGRRIPFDYFPLSGSVKALVRLQEGDNNLLITGSNESGSARDQLTVYFSPAEEIALPTVRFTNPLHSIEVNENRFPVRAVTQNVRGRNDVTLRYNGTPVSNFIFGTDGMVSVNLILAEGVNAIEILAENEAGYASDETSITYLKPVYIEPVYVDPVYHDPVNHDPVTHDPVTHDPVIRSSPPVIRIISPDSYPFTTREPSGELRATVMNVPSKENITLNVNGSDTRNFSFNSNSKLLTTRIALRDGRNVLTIRARNEAGSDAKDQVFIKENGPCALPVIRLIDPVRNPVSTNRQSYTVRAEVRNITNRNQVKLLLNGNPVSFRYDNRVLSSTITLNSGLNTLSLNAINDCGEANTSTGITYAPEVESEPCTPPTIAITVNEVNRNDATHELRGTITGVKNKSGISLTLDGRPYNGFQFNLNKQGAIGFQAASETGVLNAKFKLSPGSHTLVVSASNDCGKDAESKTVSVVRKTDEEGDEEGDEEACGIRINPGNSDWQFCLVTPSGTFSRANLASKNFSYSGPASSLFFMATGGGGNATVNGRPYPVRSGQYYLFTGSLNVTVSTNNPGSMGQWSVCVRAGRAPVSGNGANRPKSPCEAASDNTPRGNGNGNRGRR